MELPVAVRPRRVLQLLVLVREPLRLLAPRERQGFRINYRLCCRRWGRTISAVHQLLVQAVLLEPLAESPVVRPRQGQPELPIHSGRLPVLEQPVAVPNRKEFAPGVDAGRNADVVPLAGLAAVAGLECACRTDSEAGGRTAVEQV